ncbi:MAG: hypothetical protein HQK84_08085, partial [Nitrospinae bacterium]|nr:hypothetical protein [Nitrospinota bacterium]
MLIKTLFFIAILFIFPSKPFAETTSCNELIEQLNEFAAFYLENKKIQNNVKILGSICQNEEKKILLIDKLIDTSTIPSNLKSTIKERYKNLFSQGSFALQSIFQYQVDTGKTFDLNYLQNLMVRSALNGTRFINDEENKKE